MVDYQTDGTDSVPLGTPDYGADNVDAGGMDAPAPGAPIDAPTFTAGERPPGVENVPSTADGGAPAGGGPKRRRLRDVLAGKPKAPRAAAEPTAERAPRDPGRRERGPRGGKRRSGADTFGDVLFGIGSAMTQHPRHVPSGRYMQFSSAINGELMDEIVAGTLVDRLAVQRVVSGRERLDKAGAVVIPYALIFRIESLLAQDRAEEAWKLVPMLKFAFRHSAPYMLPAMKKVKKRAEDEQAAMDELAADDPNYVAGTPIEDYLFDLCFSGWTPPESGPFPGAVDAREVVPQ